MGAAARIGWEVSSAFAHLDGAEALAKLTWLMDANPTHAAMVRGVPTPRAASDTTVPVRMAFLVPTVRFLLPR